MRWPSSVSHWQGEVLGPRAPILDPVLLDTGQSRSLPGIAFSRLAPDTQAVRRAATLGRIARYAAVSLVYSVLRLTGFKHSPSGPRHVRGQMFLSTGAKVARYRGLAASACGQQRKTRHRSDPRAFQNVHQHRVWDMQQCSTVSGHTKARLHPGGGVVGKGANQA